MINSFWNLCRACPMPTEEKLNSEYKRNFTWHQNYQATKQDVIKKPPETSTPAPMEPAMPRKKKHPELAYRTNEVLKYEYEGGDSSDSMETMPSNSVHFLHVKDDQDLRARTMIQSYPPPTPARNNPNPAPNPSSNPGEVVEEPVVKTTEYRSQFAWPRPGSEAAAGTASGAKKSVSMGTIAGKRDDAGLAVHGQQRDDSEIATRTAAPPTIEAAEVPAEVDEVDRRGGEADTSSVMDGTASIFGDEQELKKSKFKKTEYKAKYRPFSTYVYVDGNWRKPPKQLVLEKKQEVDPNSWYTEVLERLKKANEYRSRARGSPIYGDQPSDMLPPTSEIFMPVTREPIAPATLPASVQRSPIKEDKLKDRSHTVPVHRPSAHKRDKSHERKSEKASVKSGESRKEKGEPLSEKKKAAEAKADAQSKADSSAAPHAAPSRGESKTPKTQTRPVGTPPLSRPRVHGDDKSKKEDKKPSHPVPAGVHSRSSSKATPSPDSSTASSKPRAVSRPSAAPAGTSVVNGEDGKIWLKPAVADDKKEKDVQDEKQPEAAEVEKPEKEAEEVAAPKESMPPPDSTDAGPVPSNEQAVEEDKDDEIEDKDAGKEKAQEPSKSPVANGDKKDVVRPNSLPPMNGVDAHAEEKISNKSRGPSPLPEPHTGPVPLTNVKSPEEVTGVKSPDPETWTVTLDTGKGLEWTDGHTPSDGGRGKSSPVIPLSKGVPVNSDYTSSPNDAGSHNHHV